MAEDIRTLQKKEAIERLKILHEKYELLENVITEFEKEDTLYYSEYKNKVFSAVLYWVSNREDLTELVKKVEEEKGILVYHAILTPTIFGTFFSMLYVSKNKKEWENEKTDLKESITSAYSINLSDIEMAEFGDIQIAGAMGGIRQIS